MSPNDPIRILFITAELAPLAKVGGLADVSGALPKAVATLGHDIRAVLPYYSVIDPETYPVKKIADQIPVPFNGLVESVSVHELTIPGSTVPLYLIEHPHYLGRGEIYFDELAGAEKVQREAERFLFFSRAAVAVPQALGWAPDIIHCQDWHVGMVPILKDILAADDTYIQKAKTLLTIHNLEYQGWYQQDMVLQLLGLTADAHPALSNTRDGQLISLRQGILTADYLNTVSETYAQEILTPEFGAQLESDLQQQSDHLTGIVNGIDVHKFDPSADPALTAPYTAADVSGKAADKQALQKLCGLPEKPDAPLLGIVTRLAEQKGVELVADVIDHIVAAGGQFVLLGTGLEALEKKIAAAAAQHPTAACARIEFDAQLAQQIYAGADMFLMPSRYEPCGLGQMIAMRYGTIPIVRATGGLKDTVAEATTDGGSGDGFVFTDYSAAAFADAISRAIHLYQTPKAWHTIVSRVMQRDFSWTTSAKKYETVYKQLTTT